MFRNVFRAWSPLVNFERRVQSYGNKKLITAYNHAIYDNSKSEKEEKIKKILFFAIVLRPLIIINQRSWRDKQLRRRTVITSLFDVLFTLLHTQCWRGRCRENKTLLKQLSLDCIFCT